MNSHSPDHEPARMDLHALEPTVAELTAVLARQAAEHDASAPTGASEFSADFAERLIADGEAMVGSWRRSALPLAASSGGGPTNIRPARRRRALFVWALATAAGLAVLLPRLAPLWQNTVADAAAPVSGPSAAQLFAELRADPAVVPVRWAESEDPAAMNADGEVWWDAARQRGVLRIRGLVPNDPRLAQYQLWIVDAERDARYPVDGGVFDIGRDGEVLVVIDARVPVRRATLFAVTLEVPGGVVVSTRERLVLTAAVGG
ncbi:anti-sigma factor domain-containing protein [Gemmatimonas sp. UBA7669]|uniref:anti-sigma factor domain-containing protein n=1 Tax=Gemmatimonas sp. UBA7669 TaxID=1946568 RepID=UPI0025B92221|nr:anti-sigma factor [Gemmatimonas sp. UBA7669]